MIVDNRKVRVEYITNDDAIDAKYTATEGFRRLLTEEAQHLADDEGSLDKSGLTIVTGNHVESAARTLLAACRGALAIDQPDGEK